MPVEPEESRAHFAATLESSLGDEGLWIYSFKLSGPERRRRHCRVRATIFLVFQGHLSTL